MYSSQSYSVNDVAVNEKWTFLKFPINSQQTPHSWPSQSLPQLYAENQFKTYSNAEGGMEFSQFQPRAVQFTMWKSSTLKEKS